MIYKNIYRFSWNESENAIFLQEPMFKIKFSTLLFVKVYLVTLVKKDKNTYKKLKIHTFYKYFSIFLLMGFHNSPESP